VGSLVFLIVFCRTRRAWLDSNYSASQARTDMMLQNL